MIRNTSRETINGSIAVNHRAFDDKLQLSFNLANSFVKVDAVSDDVDKVGDIPNYGILYQGSVDSGCGTVFQYVDRLDILGCDSVQRSHITRHTVNNNERLIATFQR